jgi:hypothetical protein
LTTGSLVDFFGTLPFLPLILPLIFIASIFIMPLPLFLSTLLCSVLFYRRPKLIFIFLPLFAAVIAFIILFSVLILPYS